MSDYVPPSVCERFMQQYVYQSASVATVLVDLGCLDEPDEPTVKHRFVYSRSDYKESLWWKMLQNPRLQDPNIKEAKVFRLRFRVPYPIYLHIADLALEWFPQAAYDVGRSRPRDV